MKLTFLTGHLWKDSEKVLVLHLSGCEVKESIQGTEKLEMRVQKTLGIVSSVLGRLFLP